LIAVYFDLVIVCHDNINCDFGKKYFFESFSFFSRKKRKKKNSPARCQRGAKVTST